MSEEIKFTDSTTEIGNKSTVSIEQLGEKQWYMVTTYATRELKVADYIRNRVETSGLQDFIKRVLVPVEEVPVMKDGKQVGVKEKPYLKGYIFVEMIMTDQAWYIIRNTPGVTGFIGSSGKGTKPFPVTREEMEPILKRAGLIDASMYDRYNVDDEVKVIHGPLEGTEGTIVSINRETGEVTVKTTFFGKETMVDVDFSEIEKI